MTKAIASAGVVALLLAVLVGCAPDVTQKPVSTTPTSELRIGLTEWEILTSSTRVVSGEVRVYVTNSGSTRHDVVINGSEGSWATPLLPPGQDYELLITTVAGEQLELECAVTGHHEQGMHATLSVVDFDDES